MLGVSTLSTLPSCKKYLSVNNSPNSSENTDPDYLFTYGAAAWCGQRAGGDLFLPVGFMAQSLADGGVSGWDASEDAYDVSPFSTGNMWRTYFATAGNNFVSAINLAKNATIKNNNAAAQSRIALAALMYECTVMYGDIPYSQAWNPVYTAPKFDGQKDVFDQIIVELDKALTEIDATNSLKITAGDLFYKGDLAKWKKAANSLKLKIYMAMVDKDPTVAAKINTLISTPTDLISSAADNMAFPFESAAGKDNPKYRLFVRYFGGSNPAIFANNNVLNIMKAHNDPRIPKWFKLPTGTTNYIGLNTSADMHDSAASISLTGLWKPTASEYILTYQEVLFFIAEAKARGLGAAKDLAAANTSYKKALSEACTLFGVAAADATTFANGFTDLATATDPVKDIHEQQWVDLMDRSVDAFTQWRRSGPEGNEVPALTLPPYAPAGGLIRRYTLPDIELTANPNAPKGIKYYDKMWFDL